MATEPDYAKGASGQFSCDACNCIRYCNVEFEREDPDGTRYLKFTCLWCKTSVVQIDPVSRLPAEPPKHPHVPRKR